MSSFLIDPSLLDAQILSAFIRDDNHISEGSNNAVWRLTGLAERPYVLRVNKERVDCFREPTAALIAEVRSTATLSACAAQSVVVFYIEGENGEKVHVADVQPEIDGKLLGLSAPQQRARSTLIYTTRGKDEKLSMGDDIFVIRPQGSQQIKIIENPAVIAETDALMIDLQTRLLAQPSPFFAQAIKDILEIEEAGYVLDPSKGQNFCFIEERGCLGFYDITQTESGRRMSPCELSTILCRPIHATWRANEPAALSAMRSHMDKQMKVKIIGVCDMLRIPYAPTYKGVPNVEESQLREEFGLQKPQGIPPILFNEMGTIIGCGVAARDINVTQEEHAPIVPQNPRPLSGHAQQFGKT